MLRDKTFLAVAILVIPWTSYAVNPSVSVQPASVTVRSGETFEICVNVNDAAAVYGYYFRLTFDGALLACTNAASGTLPAYFQWGAPVFNAQSGSVTVAGQGARAISGSGSLVRLTFLADPNALTGQSTIVRIATAELNDATVVLVSHGNISFIRPVRIAMPADLQGQPGSDIVVPVQLSDLADSVLGFYLDITYDTDFLEYTSVEEGALMTSWGPPTENATAGRIQLAAQGTTPITTNGELLKLHFHIQAYADPNQTTPIHIQQADLNDGNLESATIDGAIEVTSALSLAPAGVYLLLIMVIAIWRILTPECPFTDTKPVGEG